MSFFRFLGDQIKWCILFLLFYGLTIFIWWLSPHEVFQWTNMLYLFLLELIIFIAFLFWLYTKQMPWWQKIKKRDVEETFLSESLEGAITEEQKFYQTSFNHQLVHFQQSINELMTQQQEQKDFIDSWVHEIKVPLASLNLLKDLLEDDVPDAYFYQLEDNLHKIEQYVEQVLYYSRLDTFSKDYLLQETSLKKIIQAAAKNWSPYLIQNHLSFSVVGSDYDVLTDSKWLLFIINQLISNAIKYTPQEGKIDIQLSKQDTGICLSVCDNGIGIPLEEQGRIFDKGFTGKNGRNAIQRSTGLGLYLAKSLAEKLGHDLTVESEENVGTCVHIDFPFLRYYTDYQEEKLI